MDTKRLLSLFAVPGLVLLGIIGYLIVEYAFHRHSIAILIALAAVVIGSFELVVDTFQSLLRKNFALDYIALLAIAVGLYTGEFLVAAVITLMLAGGNTLEKYAMAQAKSSLTALTDRIPNKVVLWENGQPGRSYAIEDAKVGMCILVRKGEVIPLDGILESDRAQTDESSLTGEPYTIDKVKGDIVRSGTINTGNPLVVRVTREDSESTYRKIIEMVRQAQEERSPMVRIANRYSGVFTIITLAIAGTTFALSHSWDRVLAILVIATPCPLILATPIALMGGMNAAARKRIIIKKLAAIEVLSRADTIILDKTGTITLGRPVLAAVTVHGKRTKESVLHIADAIERNSLHPLAKAIVTAAREMPGERVTATDVEEIPGKGMRARIGKKLYTLGKTKGSDGGMSMELTENGKAIAHFSFEDGMKDDVASIIKTLQDEGYSIHIFTGDKRAATEKVISRLGAGINFKAECSPEDKKNGISSLKASGKTTVMVGDGINDAPALALAHVGMVFSHEEHTAASEAADIVFLGGDFSSVNDAITISRHTIKIAKQSIFVGIGLSVIGMLFASFGLIAPIAGAFIQEAIDVSVILNALRART